MKYVKLGNTGTKISQLILGTMQFGWRIDAESSFEVMDKAIELGINCFDTADIYTSWADNSFAGNTELIIGRWMQDRGTRDDLVLATKLRGDMSEDINNRGLSRRHINQAITGSLERLQTEWIDLYQIHSFDPDTPIEETLHSMNKLIDVGFVNYIGASNVQPWHFMEALWQADIHGYQRFETLQPVYNLARRMLVEHEFDKIVKKYKIGVIPYSPLAGGFLTGKYRRDAEIPDTPRSKGVESRYFSEKRWGILDKVLEIADVHDAKPTQIALAWMLSKDYITAPIIGANSVEQLEENIGALEIKLSDDELKQLDDASDWISDYEKIR